MFRKTIKSQVEQKAFEYLVNKKESRHSEHSKGKLLRYSNLEMQGYLSASCVNISIEEKKWLFKCRIEDIDLSTEILSFCFLLASKSQQARPNHQHVTIIILITIFIISIITIVIIIFITLGTMVRCLLTCTSSRREWRLAGRAWSWWPGAQRGCRSRGTGDVVMVRMDLKHSGDFQDVNDGGFRNEADNMIMMMKTW